MNSSRKASLKAALAEIRQRWGAEALHTLKGEAASPPRAAPTDLPALDAVLGGGIPRARITEVCGTPTSGASTLALQITARAQAEGLTAVCVDAAHVFSPDYAARFGIDLDSLLLVRPRQPADALEIAGDLVISRGADLILILSGAAPFEVPAGAWQKLAVRVAKSPAAVLVVSPVGDRASTDKSYVSLRLRVERERWLWEGVRLTGYESRVTVVKNKLGAAGASAALAVTLPEVWG